MLTSYRSGRWLAAAVAAGLTVVLAGCSGGKVATHTMTQDQATARAQQIVTETAAALSPNPGCSTHYPAGRAATASISTRMPASWLPTVVRTGKGSGNRSR